MACDLYDRLHISYYSETNQDLLYGVSLTTPSIPVDVNGTRGDHFVRLTWSAPASTGGADISNYRIFRGNSTGNEVLVATVSGTSLIYNDTAVDNGNTLYYRVVAVNSEGASLTSHEFSMNPYSSNPTTDNTALMLLIIAGVIGIVVIAVVVILVMRRVKPKNKWKQ
jgi:fibronectin type 3 domain-containing protein